MGTTCKYATTHSGCFKRHLILPHSCHSNNVHNPGRAGMITCYAAAFQERSQDVPAEVLPEGCPGACRCDDCDGRMCFLRSEKCMVFTESSITNIALNVYHCSACATERRPDGNQQLLLVKGAWSSPAFDEAGSRTTELNLRFAMLQSSYCRNVDGASASGVSAAVTISCWQHQTVCDLQTLISSSWNCRASSCHHRLPLVAAVQDSGLAGGRAELVVTVGGSHHDVRKVRLPCSSCTCTHPGWRP